MFVDLHIHSTVSDGTDTPAEIAEKISRKDGVKIFALTDHETITGIEKLPAEIFDTAFFIAGVEFFCKTTNGTKCHILAYFFNADNEEFKDMLYKDLRKCHVGDARQDAVTVINAIKEAGGVAVWAHPLGGEGEPILTQAEVLSRLQALCNLGIQGLECYYSRYTSEQEKFLAESARRNNLLISGGSDYHGLNKTIALGELGAESPVVKIHQLTILQKIFEQNKSPRIRQAFDEEIQALNLLTHDEKISYFDYVQRIKSDELATQVKIADLNHNSDLSRIPQEARTEKVFKRVEKYQQASKILGGD